MDRLVLERELRVYLVEPFGTSTLRSSRPGLRRRPTRRVTRMLSIETGDEGPSRSASCSCFLISRAIDHASPSRLRYTIGRFTRMSAIDRPLVISWKTL